MRLCNTTHSLLKGLEWFNQNRLKSERTYEAGRERSNGWLARKRLQVDIHRFPKEPPKKLAIKLLAQEIKNPREKMAKEH